MTKDKYSVSIHKKRESGITFFTAILVLVSTLYSLYISQHADFFIIDIVGDVSFVNTDAGKKVYGVVLLISAFKLLMIFGILNTKNIMKKAMYALSCLMIGSSLGLISFGQACPEMVNLSAYACQSTRLIENYSNILIMGLLIYICYKAYKEILKLEQANQRIESINNVKSI